MVNDHADKAFCQLVDFFTNQGDMGKDGIQRNTGFAQFLACVVDARIGDAQAHAFRNDVAELYGFGHHFRGDVLAEVVEQILVVQIGGDARVLPGSDRYLEAEDVIELAALFPGAEQVTNVIERVTALQQGADDFQAGQMHIGVDAGSAALFRRWQNAAVLIGTYVPHRRAAFAGQLVDGVFLVGTGVGRGVLCGRLGVFLQAAQDGCGVTVTGFHAAMIARFLHRRYRLQARVCAGSRQKGSLAAERCVALRPAGLAYGESSTWARFLARLGVKRPNHCMPTASGLTGTTAWLVSTARTMAAATRSGVNARRW